MTIDIILGTGIVLVALGLYGVLRELQATKRRVAMLRRSTMDELVTLDTRVKLLERRFNKPVADAGWRENGSRQ